MIKRMQIVWFAFIVLSCGKWAHSNVSRTESDRADGSDSKLHSDLDAALRFEFRQPTASSLKNRVKLWATEYHIHQALESESGHPLLDLQGQEISGKLTHHDWCESALEGTVALKSLKGTLSVFNYAGVADATQVDCYGKYPRLPERVRVKMGKTRFRPAIGPYGDGYDGHIILPFRSLAVDTRYFPMRTLFYIPAARGTKFKLPSGEERTHDGFFFAADIGGAIKENHIDVFIGISESNPFSFIRGPNHLFDAYVMNDENISEILTSGHLPQGN